MTVEVYVRGSNRETIGHITSWSSLTLVQRRNDVGRWTLTLHSADDADLFQPGTGILIRRENVTLVSGWLDQESFTKTGAQAEWVLSGWDDVIYLADTACWPTPTAAITAQTSAYHIVTGPASTRVATYWTANAVNRLAIGGAIAPTDPAIGTTGTSRARFHDLLGIVQRNCAKTVNVRIVQDDTNLTITPAFSAPRDLTLAVQFSPEVGTVLGYTWTDTHPTVTRAYLAAENTGAARIMRAQTDTAAEAVWSSVRKPETFLDRRDLTSTDLTFNDEVTEALTEALLEGRRRISFGMQVTDVEGMRYGVDYLVGDKVRAYPEPGVPLDDLVEEVEVTWDAEAGETAQVWVGPREDPEEADVRRERDLHRRISRLEKAQ